jgi:hypothetical protein
MNRGIALEIKGKRVEANKDFQQCLEINSGLKQILEARRKEVAQKNAVQH